MSGLLTVKIGGNTSEIASILEGSNDAALPRVAAAMDTRNQAVKGYIQERKLSQKGPTTLGVGESKNGHIGGRLRQSVNAVSSRIEGNKVSSAIGSNVIYAAVHEYGFDGNVQVSAHQRTIKVTRPSFDNRGRERSKKYKISGQVRAHTRHMKLPARRMFRSGIEENLPRYTNDIAQAYAGALRDKGVGK